MDSINIKVICVTQVVYSNIIGPSSEVRRALIILHIFTSSWKPQDQLIALPISCLKHVRVKRKWEICEQTSPCVKVAKKRQFSKIFFCTPTHAEKNNKCKIMMSMKVPLRKLQNPLPMGQGFKALKWDRYF